MKKQCIIKKVLFDAILTSGILTGLVFFFMMIGHAFVILINETVNKNIYGTYTMLGFMIISTFIIIYIWLSIYIDHIKNKCN